MEQLVTEAKAALEKSDPALARVAHSLIPRLVAEIKRLTKRLDEVEGHGCGRGNCAIKRCQGTGEGGREAQGGGQAAENGSSAPAGLVDQCGLPNLGGDHG